MLGTHVENLQFVVVGDVVVYEVVVDDGAAMNVEGGISLRLEHLLGTFVGVAAHPSRFLGSGDPHAVNLATRRSRLRCRIGGGSRCLGGGSFQVSGYNVGRVTHLALGDSLNRTGTEPTE